MALEEQMLAKLEDWHDLSEENPRLSSALVAGSAAAAWYAMPDFVRSKTLRFVGKAALVGGVISYYSHLPEVPEITAEATDELKEQWRESYFGSLNTGTQLAILAGLLGGSIWLDQTIERAILRRGERRRKKGVKLPHLRQGLVIGALIGALAYMDHDA